MVLDDSIPEQSQKEMTVSIQTSEESEITAEDIYRAQVPHHYIGALGNLKTALNFLVNLGPYSVKFFLRKERQFSYTMHVFAIRPIESIMHIAALHQPSQVQLNQDGNLKHFLND